jgi:hypothetical protein
MLRPELIETIAKDGLRILQRMLTRHAAFRNLPSPLLGKALHKNVAELGLVARTMTVRVDTRTIRKECNLAQSRRKMKMSEEIGRQCNMF